MELGDAGEFITSAIERKDMKTLQGLKEWLEEWLSKVNAALGKLAVEPRQIKEGP